ncbi:hypothetical protein KIN20_018244 [Parelaphostrongylus tenuis]|uniref:Hyaluronidase n=1 Tax=Parelaphostrongylus tenuis TaxID=148309 RepID=A0AAD5N3E5_PARTN|nr:hypothetical protein KIN20_018244 [Parelaphostrongylus tenuis]
MRAGVFMDFPTVITMLATMVTILVPGNIKATMMKWNTSTVKATFCSHQFICMIRSYPNIVFSYVQAILTETLRVANKYDQPLSIFPYSKFEHDPSEEIDSFYNYLDLCSTIKQSSDFGIDGLIFWSSSTNIEYRCDTIKNYTESFLGPYTQFVIKRRHDCEIANNCNIGQKCSLKKSVTTPPYPYSVICNSTITNSTDYSEYECV